MIPAHASAEARAEVAGVAAAERDARAKAYPPMVARGEVSGAEAEADYQAWAGIADWCAGKGLPGWTTNDAMVAAAAAGLARREAALAEAPAEKRASLQERRDAGARIHAMLAAHSESCARITAAVNADIAADRGRAA